MKVNAVLVKYAQNCQVIHLFLLLQHIVELRVEGV
jgi:hypothetical protein